ncbi:MAG TPA: VIT domain-containing protein [Pyrinomonadaceae bacterium]|nr:VIT domain-containing protein [Pyrinomonadaceae bacterium]
MSEDSNNTKVASPLADHSFSLGFIVCAGILLPVITLIFELSTKMCADSFFDPVPSLWHVLVVGLVPLANTQILWSLYRNNLERINFLAWISTLSAGACLFYSIFFLPMSPISIIGIVFYGLGLLPLSPMFALWAILLLRKYLLKNIQTKPFPLTWKGLGTGFLIIVSVITLSELRFVVTRFGLEMATAESVERQEQGLDFLRKYGSDDYILQLVNSRRQRVYISDLVIGFFSRSDVGSNEKAKEVYYRLTGKTYDSVALPPRIGLFDFGDEDERFWREKDVSLVASQMDGSIDNDASIGYLEWTFVLKNKNQYRDQEGFTQIQLPPNAVVSRLTLWINGEEREAAFAERNRVTTAYEQVTARKRDPVLVTTAGRDRVNLKCFPIPQNGGEMKMRIGITFPLILEDQKNGLIRLPYFRDKNFNVPSEIKHIVWLESKRELQSANKNLKLETTDNIFAVRGNITDKELLDANSSIRAFKSDEFKSVWTKDGDNFITQEVTENVGVKPAQFIFVVDTSVSMKNEQQKLVSVINNLPPESETSLVLTNGNSLNRELSYPNSISGKPAEIAEKIQKATFDGGTDNLPALTKGWDLAAQKPNSVVIWVHAPQPFKFSTSFELAQRLTRRPNATAIYDISTDSGFDTVEKELDNLNYIQNVPRFGDMQSDLERLISLLAQSKKGFGYSRVNTAKADLTVSKETSKHLVRLWANDEVNRILATEKGEKKAVELAVKNQIVTPVTGAVVLETQQQYDQFGLKPVDKSSVPTIPEPETYLLIAVVLGALVWLFATRKLF